MFVIFVSVGKHCCLFLVRIALPQSSKVDYNLWDAESLISASSTLALCVLIKQDSRIPQALARYACHSATYSRSSNLKTKSLRPCRVEDICKRRNLSEENLIPNALNHQSYISTNLLDPNAEIEAAGNRSDANPTERLSWSSSNKGSRTCH